MECHNSAIKYTNTILEGGILFPASWKVVRDWGIKSQITYCLYFVDNLKATNIDNVCEQLMCHSVENLLNL